VDPELNIVYWTFGNPFPVMDGSTRGGDNLYSDSIVAMDAHTGTYLWHFQTVKHDLWDADNTMAPVLMDLQVHGKKRKAVAVAGKTGYLYIFDRVTGEPLQGMPNKPVPQEPRQLTSATQPIPVGDPFVPLCPDARVEPSLRPVPNSRSKLYRRLSVYTFLGQDHARDPWKRRSRHVGRDFVQPADWTGVLRSRLDQRCMDQYREVPTDW
jgi:hypothetical protein